MEIHTEHYKDWDIVSIHGELVIQNLSQIRPVLKKLEEESTSPVAIDITHLTYLDTSAITSILNFHERLDQQSRKVTLIGPNKEVKDVFSIINITEAIPVFNSRPEFENIFD